MPVFDDPSGICQVTRRTYTPKGQQVFSEGRHRDLQWPVQSAQQWCEVLDLPGDQVANVSPVGLWRRQLFRRARSA